MISTRTPPVPCARVSMLCTGVAKSSTSRRCARFGGRLTLERSTTTLVPSRRRFAATPGAGEGDDDAAFAVLAAPEVDVGNLKTMHRHGLGRIGRGSRYGRWRRAGVAAGDRQGHRVAAAAGLVRRGAEEIDDDARASRRFDRRDGRCCAGADVDAPLRDAVARVGQIDGDARRRVGLEDLRRRNRLRELQRDLDLAARQGRVGNVLEHVLGVRGPGDQERQQDDEPEEARSHRRLGEPALRALSRYRDHVINPQRDLNYFLVSPKAIVACRSIHPPEPFGTSSTSSMWSSPMPVMRP